VTRYLVDNSVLHRLSRSTAVAGAVNAIIDREDELCSCVATLDEFVYSAAFRDRTRRSSAPAAQLIPVSTDASADRSARDRHPDSPVRGRKGPRRRVIDVQIAATAAHHNATVLHYDADFDYITRAYAQAKSTSVVPRGTVD
jgi:predicted nucleic acid-binding protein